MRFKASLKTRSLSLSLLILLVCICPPALGSDARFSSGKSALAIPFELEDNIIYVPVSINGSKALSFILDTGAYTIVHLRHARELGVKLKLTGQTGGVGDEQEDVFLAAEKVSFSLPGVTLSNQRLLAISLGKVEDCVNEFVVDEEGRLASFAQPAPKGVRRKVDGILGKEFFGSFVVEIDYASRLINVYEPRSYKYAGKGERLTLDVAPQHIFVQAQISTRAREPLTARFLVDTGGAMALTLTKRFTEEHRLLPPREELTDVPLCGIAGMMKERSLLGNIEAVQLGSLKIMNPTVEFRRAPVTYDFDGFIGGSVLRRHKVIFDYSRRRMIMEPAGGKVSRESVRPPGKAQSNDSFNRS